MGTTFQPPSFAELIARFGRVLDGHNCSPHTIAAYERDLRQFVGWLAEQHPDVAAPAQITRAHLNDYLGHLATQQLAGVTRARKLAAIRAFFRHLENEGAIAASPAGAVQTPRKERRVPAYLTRSEYSRLLALAGANPRDFALLTLFLQTGIRVSELCALRIADVDLSGRSLRVRGKGQVERVIELERKGLQALRRWLQVRPNALTERLFLNRYGEPLGERGVKKLVATYRIRAGITKQVGAHGLRHTFATAKAEQGVSPFLLQEWLGHHNLNTTQRYVTLARTNAHKVMEDTSL